MEKVTFTEITGEERFKVTDLVSDGVSFYDTAEGAYKRAAQLAVTLGHGYQIEDRARRWISTGGPGVQIV